MLLHSLIELLHDAIPAAGMPNPAVSGVSEDSRLIRSGDLFVARAGTKTDGRSYLADAKARGAVAVVVERLSPDIDLPQIIVPRAGDAASILANALLDMPSDDVRVLGVTGTNGKTTTTYVLRHLLRTAGRRCGMIGTVEVDDGRTTREADMTTPAACDIAQMLASMRENKCDACAIEASSHALDQGRVAGIKFAGAAFTNLTGDHLDYHKTMENYAAAKARLFASLPEDATAAVNATDPASERMVRDCRAHVVRYATSGDAEYLALNPEIQPTGTTFHLRVRQGKPIRVNLPMIGLHNVENALAAAALAGEVFGLTPAVIAEALSTATGAPGRLQPVHCGQPFGVFVDYAHTDDGLENVLVALRPVTRGKLRVLFGCGGDRDATKRPRMAAVAERLADALYITSDNPRTEDPNKIIEQIKAGLTQAGRQRAAVDPDRRSAIERILAEARPGDVVLIAGKGHENYQIVGKEKRHFDDVEEATRVLRGRGIAA